MIHSGLFRQLKKTVSVTAAALIAACFTSGCAGAAPQSASGLVMDTVFTVTVYGGGAEPSELLEIGNDLDTNVLSRFSEGSLVSGYNSGESSGDLQAYLDRCSEINDASGGSFDVSVATLSDLWGIDADAKEEAEFRLPSEDEIRAALESDTVDLGAVGKGIYLDEVYSVLAERDVKGAVISAGGSILVYGEKPDGSAFKVGVKDPFGESKSGTFGIIQIGGGYFVSTSGSYERFCEYEGRTYHHILNPATGYPAWSAEDMELRNEITDVIPVSVTIIGKDGFLSDALSTACFVLGPEKGIELASRYACEAIYIMNDGSVMTSDGIITDRADGYIFKLA